MSLLAFYCCIHSKTHGLISKLADRSEKQSKLMFSAWLTDAIPHLFLKDKENSIETKCLEEHLEIWKIWTKFLISILLFRSFL